MFDCGRNDIQRMLGNAVPSLIGEVIGRAIRAQLLGKPVKKKKKLALLQPRRKTTPEPEPVAEVQISYRALVGDHSEHPGTGQGNRARQKLAE